MQEAEAILSFGIGSRKHHKTDASATLVTATGGYHVVNRYFISNEAIFY